MINKEYFFIFLVNFRGLHCREYMSGAKESKYCPNKGVFNYISGDYQDQGKLEVIYF